MRLHLAVVASAAFAAVPSSAQQPTAAAAAGHATVTSPQWQRARAVWFTQGNNPVGAEVCVGMAQAPFDDDSKKRMDDAKAGDRIALGGDWATLDTFTGLEFGDVKVPKGDYYLALEKDKKGWVLVILDPAKVQKAQALPPAGGKDKPVARVPLQHADATPAELGCDIAPDATAGTAVLKCSWGPHAWFSNRRFELPVNCPGRCPRATGSDYAARCSRGALASSRTSRRNSRRSSGVKASLPKRARR